MATRLSKALPSGLRFEPSPKWIRAERNGRVVVDTTEAVIVWGPDETVPRYAVPASDVDRDAVPEEALARCGDPDLADFVLLDWDAFDRWREEEDEVIGHPRDPFHRVDIRHSTRHVEVRCDGMLLAAGDRPVLVFETGLPVRYYLRPVGGRTEEDLAWCYAEPLPDNAELTGLIAFFNERSDITVDGRLEERPRTQWS